MSTLITKVALNCWQTDTGDTASTRDEALILVGRRDIWQRSVWSAVRAMETAGLDHEQVASFLHDRHSDPF